MSEEGHTLRRISPRVRQTKRLTLRPPVLADAEPIFTGYASDEEVTRYLVWRPHGSVEATRAFVKKCIEQWSAQSGEDTRTWVLCERERPQAPIGMISLRLEASFKALAGYVLAKSYWGRGYMAEALEAVVTIAFSEAGLRRVGAYCDLDNVGSARVMEKAGLQKEGVLRQYAMHPNVSSKPRDVVLYAKTFNGS